MWWHRFRSRRAQALERAEEMRAHIDLLAEQLIARGRTVEQAAREARLEFGNPRAKLEEIDEMNRLPFVETFILELRSAVRSLRAAPGFTAVVLAVLTLAMGATTLVFSLVDAVALRGLPFEESDRIVAFDVTSKGKIVPTRLAAPDFLALRSVNAFEQVAAVAPGTVELRRDAANSPEVVVSERVSLEFFRVLRVAPAIGRAFASENEVAGRDRVAVISDPLWRRRFGARRDIVGQKLPAVGGDIEVIGVMPRGFTYPVGEEHATEVWVPYAIPDGERSERVSSYLRPIARLARGVTLDDAHARVDALNLPSSPLGVVTVGREGRLTIQPLRDSLVGSSREAMVMLLAAVACVLLVASVNIANLLMVRASVRARELSVRVALGATRWQIARMLLTESLVLSCTGTTLGVFFAWWGLGALRAFLPGELPRIANIGIDLRVLGVSAAAALITGVAFGLAPAFQRVDAIDQTLRANARMNTPSRRSHWLRTSLTVAEVALAVVLLVGAALFLTSFAKVVRIDVGLDYRNVLLVNATQGNADDLIRIAERVKGIPGVETASVGRGSVPFSFLATTMAFWPGGVQPPQPHYGVAATGVSPEYFRALRIPVIRGRGFTAADTFGSDPVVILNETTADHYFPQQDAIGKTVDFSGTRTIIGVVGDVRGNGPEFKISDEAFLPLAQWERKNRPGGTLIIRTTGRPAAIADDVRSAIWSAFPDVVIPAPHTLAERYGLYIATRRFNMIVLSFFGFLGVAIAGIGIYGVMAHTVAQRTREIGIRMALGAQPGTVLRSVLRTASAQVLIGSAAGLGVAWLLAASVKRLLYKVAPHDLRLYGAVSVVLIVIALAAAYVPARRAAKVDPLIALRLE